MLLKTGNRYKRISVLQYESSTDGEIVSDRIKKKISAKTIRRLSDAKNETTDSMTYGRVLKFINRYGPLTE